MDKHSSITVEVEGRVALVTLNRPEALNALNESVMRELTRAIGDLDAQPGICVMVLTGAGRAFAAGADIKEMSTRQYSHMYLADWFAGWDRLAATRKPMIAAVRGYALGGGCELAMMCDLIIAADDARFGQPEIKLGIPPGIGGSQRLTRAIGKAKAMEMCLTGRTMDAAEAERCGLVARVVPSDELMSEARAVAGSVAAMSLPALLAVKECVNRSYESSLSEGVLFERRTFYAAFATFDQKEGMTAFLEKRQPAFRDC